MSAGESKSLIQESQEVQDQAAATAAAAKAERDRLNAPRKSDGRFVGQPAPTLDSGDGRGALTAAQRGSYPAGKEGEQFRLDTLQWMHDNNHPLPAGMNPFDALTPEEEATQAAAREAEYERTGIRPGPA